MRVIFPLLKPPVITVTILNEMWIWNDYLLPSLMLGHNGKVKTLLLKSKLWVVLLMVLLNLRVDITQEYLVYCIHLVRE